MNFPTKKLFFYFLPIILIGGIFSVWNNARGSSVKNANGSLSVERNGSLISSDLKSDGKFKDWQGTLNSQAATSSSQSPSYSQASNKTENLSKQLFSDYLTLKSSGQASDSEAIKQTAERIAQGVGSIKIDTAYTQKNIIINAGASSDDSRVYANTIGKIRQSYRDQFAKNASGDSYISPSDKNFQTNISFAASLYAAQAKELIKVSVPSDLADIHLRLINSYAGSGAGLEKMSLLENDPLMSAVGIKQFDSESKNEAVILEELRIKLLSNGIVFTQDDNAMLLWIN